MPTSDRYFMDAFSKVAVLNSGRGSRPGLSSSFNDVGDGWYTKVFIDVIDRAQVRNSYCQSALSIFAVFSAMVLPRVRFWVNCGGIERVLPSIMRRKPAHCSNALGPKRGTFSVRCVTQTTVFITIIDNVLRHGAAESPQHESVALPKRYSHPHLRRLHSPQQSHPDVSPAGFG